jgi:CubicO group peptidase (beta-lactamase class C family)
MLESQAESVVDEVPPFTKLSQAIFWHKILDANGVSRYWGHFGSDPGAATFLAFDPERHVGVIGFINTNDNKSLTLTFRQIMFRLFEAAKK